MPDTSAATAPEGSSAAELRRLDTRATDYRFTLDDVPWDLLDAPGALAGPTLRRLLDHEAIDGARIAVAFASLERDLVAFLEAEHADGPTEGSEQPGARSVALLLEEEVRHAELFDRLAAHFGATGQPPPDTFRRLRLVEDPVVRRHLFWLHCLFFEELTVWIHDALARDTGIQPTWLAAHRLHAREETQHVLTDAAQLDASPVDEPLRERLSRAFVLYIDQHIDDFFGIDALATDGRARRLRDLPLFDEVLTHRAFRRTRSAAPYLATLRARREARLSGPALPASRDTLPAALERSAASARGISFLGRGVATLSYTQLYERAVATLGGLQGRGLRPGDPVVVVCGQPATAVEALWGCLLGGLVPALVPLPSGGRDSESHRRLLRVAAQLDAPLLTDQQGPVGDATELGRKVLRLADLGGGAPGALHQAEPDDLALLQYSSGSLGQPRAAPRRPAHPPAGPL